MTDDEIKGLFSFYGQYVSGKDYALIRAIEKVTSPQRTWIGLTDEEILSISADCAATHQHTDIHFAKAIEAKLKEKNS